MASNPRPFSPRAENGLDSSFALLSLRSRNRARSLLIRVSRATTPSPGKKKKMGARLLVCGAKQRGSQGGMAPLVTGLSPRRGAGSGATVGGGKRSFLPQEADVGTERADETKPEPLHLVFSEVLGFEVFQPVAQFFRIFPVLVELEALGALHDFVLDKDGRICPQGEGDGIRWP